MYILYYLFVKILTDFAFYVHLKKLNLIYIQDL